MQSRQRLDDIQVSYNNSRKESPDKPYRDEQPAKAELVSIKEEEIPKSLTDLCRKHELLPPISSETKDNPTHVTIDQPSTANNRNVPEVARPISEPHIFSNSVNKQAYSPAHSPEREAMEQNQESEAPNMRGSAEQKESPLSSNRLSTNEMADSLYKSYIRCHLITKRKYTQMAASVARVKFSDIVYHAICPLKTKKKPYEQAFESIKSQGHCIEITRLAECMNKVDKMLKLFLTQDQLLLFNLIPMYEVDYYNRASDPYEFSPFEFSMADKCRAAAGRLANKENKSEIDNNLLRHTSYILSDITDK